MQVNDFKNKAHNMVRADDPGAIEAKSIVTSCVISHNSDIIDRLIFERFIEKAKFLNVELNIESRQLSLEV